MNPKQRFNGTDDEICYVTIAITNVKKPVSTLWTQLIGIYNTHTSVLVMFFLPNLPTCNRVLNPSGYYAYIYNFQSSRLANTVRYLPLTNISHLPKKMYSSNPPITCQGCATTTIGLFFNLYTHNTN